MRYSKIFGKSRHNAPCDANSVNARFLSQGGFMEKVSAGIYSYLPLGKRVLDKVARIIREEMDVVGGQEISMPALHPISLWETTGRDRTMDEILYRTSGAGNKDFILGPSHEETVTPLAVSCISSYKDLPLCVYQIQTKFRNEARAKSGVLRGREFGMKDMYSFHTDEKDLDEYYELVKDAYSRVFERCGLKSYIIEASGGAFCDKLSHEFAVETPAGEDTIILCDECGFAQNLEIATGKVVEEESSEEELPLKMVDVEKKEGTVEEDARLHAVPQSKVLKTVVYEVEEIGFVGIVIRGDLQINEIKLENYFKKRLRPASREGLTALSLVCGYISPVGIDPKIALRFIADHSIKNVKNFVTGANEKGKDYVNVNIGRDFVIDDFTDLVEVRGGAACPNCGEALRELKGVETGNIFKLGTKYSEAFDLKFTDKKGEAHFVVMGCYGIGTTRLVGTIVEACHDEKGIIWPFSVAPYHVHLMHLGADKEVVAFAEEIYEQLTANGIEVLYDDRDESPGVKFNDCDLIGIPLRVLISGKTVEKNCVEIKSRSEQNGALLERGDVLPEIEKILKSNNV